MLCDLLNVFKPGLVPRVARAADMSGLHESKRNARMRENIGQYVDGCAWLDLTRLCELMCPPSRRMREPSPTPRRCAELGVPQREVSTQWLEPPPPPKTGRHRREEPTSPELQRGLS